MTHPLRDRSSLLHLPTQFHSPKGRYGSTPNVKLERLQTVIWLFPAHCKPPKDSTRGWSIICHKMFTGILAQWADGNLSGMFGRTLATGKPWPISTSARGRSVAGWVAAWPPRKIRQCSRVESRVPNGRCERWPPRPNLCILSTQRNEPPRRTGRRPGTTEGPGPGVAHGW